MTTSPYTQGKGLIAKASFQFTNPETRRRVTIREGQRFWITSSQCLIKLERAVRIDREGKGYISQGWPFSEAMLGEFFTHAN